MQAGFAICGSQGPRSGVALGVDIERTLPRRGRATYRSATCCPSHGAEQARAARQGPLDARRGPVRVDSKRGGAASGQFATNVRIEVAPATDRRWGRSPGPVKSSCG